MLVYESVRVVIMCVGLLNSNVTLYLNLGSNVEQILVDIRELLLKIKPGLLVERSESSGSFCIPNKSTVEPHLSIELQWE